MTPATTRKETVVYRTRDGDAVDAIARRHYGPRAGLVEAVLEANPGLADHGARLPAGLLIALPPLPPEPPARLARLFD